MARDTPRVLPVLRLWRHTLGGMLPTPDLESEQRKALGALELCLAALEGADWRQISMCLGLHLEGVSDGLRRDMRSCSTLDGLWSLLVDAVAGSTVSPASRFWWKPLRLRLGFPRNGLHGSRP